VSDFSEPIEPFFKSNRTCQPDPGRGMKHLIPRVGEGVPGFGIKRAPFRVGVIAGWTTRPHRRLQAWFIQWVSKFQNWNWNQEICN
jgi:hypothetical protein